MDQLVSAVARRVAVARSAGFVRVLNSEKGHRVERVQLALRVKQAQRQQRTMEQRRGRHAR